MMGRSLFDILSHMNGAEIACGICSFLIKNQPTVSLPSDQDVLEVLTDEKCINELLNTELTMCNTVANQINILAINYLKAYFEMSLDSQFCSNQLVNMIHYNIQLNNIDASKSIFAITFLGQDYVNPTEKELFQFEEIVEQHGYYVLNLA